MEKEKVQLLLDYFWEAAALCNECDIYEYDNLDEALQEMKKWVDENFGRKLTTK